MPTPPTAATLLRGMQIELQYCLNKYLNDTGQTLEQVAEAAGVSTVVVKQMAAGTYGGTLSYMVTVLLAIGKVPNITLIPAPVGVL